MALTLSVVFLGSLCSLILIGKIFKLGKDFEKNYGVGIGWLFYLIAGIITAIVYVNL